MQTAAGTGSIGRRAFLAALLGVAIGPLDATLVGVALPTISASRGGDIASAQLVVASYLVALIAAYVPAGRAVDSGAPERILRLGFALFLAGAGVALLAPAFEVVLVGRALQGVGAAATASAAQAFAFARTGGRRAGRDLGFVHVAVAVGMLLGPLLGGLVVERAPWQTIFAIDVAAAAFALALAPRGAIVLVRASAPARPMQRSSLAIGLAVAALAFVAMSANMFVVPYLLQRPLALGPAAAGALMTVVPAVILIAAVPAGVLADRYGSRWPAAAGLALVTVAIAALAFAVAAPVWIAGAVLAVYALGAALFQAPNNRAILAAAPTTAVGLASGLLGTARQVGQLIGVAASGALLAGGGGLEAPAAYMGAFLALAAIGGIALALALVRTSDVRASTGSRRPF